MALDVSIACWIYDRTIPLMDGRVKIPGVNPKITILNPEEAFDVTFADPQYEIGEMSLSYQLSAIARGDAQYQAIPIYLSRSFRHATIFIRTDRGIKSPKDLKGKTMAVQDYDMTAAVIVRELLRDQYGVEASDIRWRLGDVETRWRKVVPGKTVPGVEIEVIQDKILDDLFAAGEIDSLITLRPLKSFTSGKYPIARLFPDWRAAEKEYYKRTKFFPIMHVLGLRRDLVAKNPDLSQKVYDAFSAAKKIAITELTNSQVPKATLPWCEAELIETRAIMGEDYWPYGVGPNRDTLTRFIKHHHYEGLSNREIPLEELFPLGVKE